MTDAPRRLLAFLHGIHFENYSRKRAARALGISEGSITRALQVLRFAQAVKFEPGGRSTSSKLHGLMTVEEFLSRYQNLSHYRLKLSRYVGVFEPLSDPIKTLGSNTRKKPAARQDFVLPPREIANEYGRRMPNPDYLRIEEALRRARGRIEAAGNPVAYERAIIREELAKAASA